MKPRKIHFIMSVLAGLTLLTACEQSADTDPVAETARAALSGGVTAKERIKTRQAQLKKMGKAFKTISDELKASGPDRAKIRSAAATLPRAATGMVNWFPRGTGPEAGVKTAALPDIWKNKPDFNDKVAAMQDAAAQLQAVAQKGNVAAIAAQFRTTGGKCKDCHDKYRSDD